MKWLIDRIGGSECRFLLSCPSGTAQSPCHFGLPLQLASSDRHSRQQKLALKAGYGAGFLNIRFNDHPQPHFVPAKRSNDVLLQKDEDHNNRENEFYDWKMLFVAEKVANQWVSSQVGTAVPLNWDTMKYRTFRVIFINRATSQALHHSSGRLQVTTATYSTDSVFPESCEWNLECVDHSWSAGEVAISVIVPVVAVAAVATTVAVKVASVGSKLLTNTETALPSFPPESQTGSTVPPIAQAPETAPTQASPSAAAPVQRDSRQQAIFSRILQPGVLRMFYYVLPVFQLFVYILALYVLLKKV